MTDLKKWFFYGGLEEELQEKSVDLGLRHRSLSAIAIKL